MQDVQRRQRNVVFPDTVNNEARFWRNIIEGRQRLTLIQKVGVSIIALAMAILAFVMTFDGNNPFSADFSWGRLLNALLIWVIAFCFLALILVAFRISQWLQRK